MHFFGKYGISAPNQMANQIMKWLAALKKKKKKKKTAVELRVSIASYLCAYNLECDITVPAHFAFHAFNMQPHGSSSCMMEESSADRNQRLAHLRAQRHRAQQRRDSPRRSQRLASPREHEARHREQE